MAFLIDDAKLRVSLDDQLSSALANLTIGYFFQKMIKLAADFEQQMRNANSIFLETEANFKKLQEDVLSLGGKTTQSLTNVAKSLYNLASAGLNAKESFAVLKDSMKLAEATGEDIDMITEAVAKFARGFKISFSESSKIVNEFASLINSTQIKFKDIFASMKFATQIGALFPKQKLDEVLTYLGLLVNKGIPASTAMRQLRSVMIDLSKESGKLNKFLKKYGLTIEDVSMDSNKFYEVLVKLKNAGASNADIMKLFGKRASGAFKILMNEGIEAYLRLNEKIKEHGVLQQQIEEQHNTMNAQMKMLWTNVQKVIIPALEIFTDGIKNAAKTANWFFGVFDSGIPIINEIIKYISQLGVAFMAIPLGKAALQLAKVSASMLGLTKVTALLNTDFAALGITMKNVAGVITLLVSAYELYNVAAKYNEAIIADITKGIWANTEAAKQWHIINQKIIIGKRTHNKLMVLEGELQALSMKQGNALLHLDWKLYQQLTLEIKEKKKLIDKLKKEQEEIARLQKIKNNLLDTYDKENRKLNEYKQQLEDLEILYSKNMLTEKEYLKIKTKLNQEITKLNFKNLINDNQIYNQILKDRSESIQTLQEKYNYLQSVLKDLQEEYNNTWHSNEDLRIAIQSLENQMLQLENVIKKKQILKAWRDGIISTEQAFIELVQVGLDKTSLMEEGLIRSAENVQRQIKDKFFEKTQNNIFQLVKDNKQLEYVFNELGLTVEIASKKAIKGLNNVDLKVKSTFKNMSKESKKTFEPLKKDIIVVEEKFVKMAKTMLSKANNVHGVFVRYLKDGMYEIEVFHNATQQQMDDLFSSIQENINQAGNNFNSFVNYIYHIFNKVGEIINKALNGNLLDAFNQAYDLLGDFANNVINMMNDIFGNLSSQTNTYINNSMQDLENYANSLRNIKNEIGNVKKELNDLKHQQSQISQSNNSTNTSSSQSNNSSSSQVYYGQGQPLVIMRNKRTGQYQRMVILDGGGLVTFEGWQRALGDANELTWRGLDNDWDHIIRKYLVNPKDWELVSMHAKASADNGYQLYTADFSKYLTKKQTQPSTNQSLPIQTYNSNILPYSMMNGDTSVLQTNLQDQILPILKYSNNRTQLHEFQAYTQNMNSDISLDTFVENRYKLDNYKHYNIWKKLSEQGKQQLTDMLLHGADMWGKDVRELIAKDILQPYGNIYENYKKGYYDVENGVSYIRPGHDPEGLRFLGMKNDSDFQHLLKLIDDLKNILHFEYTKKTNKDWVQIQISSEYKDDINKILNALTGVYGFNVSKTFGYI